MPTRFSRRWSYHPATAPTLHPGYERGDVRVGQFPLLRHLDVAVVADDLDQQALVGFAYFDERAVLRSGRETGLRIEPEPALLLLRPMTRYALAHQNGPDPLLEELGIHRLLGADPGIRGEQRNQSNGGTAHEAGWEGRGKAPSIFTDSASECNRAFYAQANAGLCLL